jgi:hypothetical protein
MCFVANITYYFYLSLVELQNIDPPNFRFWILDFGFWIESKIQNCLTSYLSQNCEKCMFFREKCSYLRVKNLILSREKSLRR